MLFQGVRSPEAYWKTGMFCQGSKLGIPSAFSFVFVNCICIIQDKRLLSESSAEFRNIVLAICTGAFDTPCKDLAQHTSFAMKHAAKLTHHASYQDNSNKTMH
jgi:hypothetical protein